MVDETSNTLDTYDSCPPYDSTTGDSTGKVRTRRLKRRETPQGEFQPNYTGIVVLKGRWDISGSTSSITGRSSSGENSGC